MIRLPIGFNTIITNKGVESSKTLTSKDFYPDDVPHRDQGHLSNFSDHLPLGPGMNILLGPARSLKTTALLGLCATCGIEPIVYHEVLGPAEERLILGPEELVGAIEQRLEKYATVPRREGHDFFRMVGIDSLSTMMLYTPPGENIAVGASGRSNTFLIALRQWDAVFAHMGVSCVAIVTPPSSTPAAYADVESVLLGSVASISSFAPPQVGGGASGIKFSSRRPLKKAPLGDRAERELSIDDFLTSPVDSAHGDKLFDSVQAGPSAIHTRLLISGMQSN